MPPALRRVSVPSALAFATRTLLAHPVELVVLPSVLGLAFALPEFAVVAARTLSDPEGPPRLGYSLASLLGRLLHLAGAVTLAIGAARAVDAVDGGGLSFAGGVRASVRRIPRVVARAALALFLGGITLVLPLAILSALFEWRSGPIYEFGPLVVACFVTWLVTAWTLPTVGVVGARKNDGGDDGTRGRLAPRRGAWLALAALPAWVVLPALAAFAGAVHSDDATLKLAFRAAHDAARAEVLIDTGVALVRVVVQAICAVLLGIAAHRIVHGEDGPPLPDVVEEFS